MKAHRWQCVFCEVSGVGIRSHLMHNRTYHPLLDFNAAMVARFGRMRVIETDQFRGRRYRCACGWEGWTVWGRALKHAETCPRANEEVKP